MGLSGATSPPPLAQPPPPMPATSVAADILQRQLAAAAQPQEGETEKSLTPTDAQKLAGIGQQASAQQGVS